MPTCLHAYMPTCLHAYMPTCLHIRMLCPFDNRSAPVGNLYQHALDICTRLLVRVVIYIRRCVGAHKCVHAEHVCAHLFALPYLNCRRQLYAHLPPKFSLTYFLCCREQSTTSGRGRLWKGPSKLGTPRLCIHAIFDHQTYIGNNELVHAMMMVHACPSMYASHVEEVLTRFTKTSDKGHEIVHTCPAGNGSLRIQPYSKPSYLPILTICDTDRICKYIGRAALERQMQMMSSMPTPSKQVMEALERLCPGTSFSRTTHAAHANGSASCLLHTHLSRVECLTSK
jgi:hypothetical protein